MPFASSSALIAAYLALSARALPRPNPAATYQVVDVGGPSSEIALPETVYSTIVESSTPTTVTESAVTVTATPDAPAVETQSVTTTQKWTDSISNTELPAYSHSSGSPPLPTLDDTLAPPPATATETMTVINTVPVAPYAAESMLSTTSSSSLRPAFTQVAQWNHTVSAIPGPTSAGTALMYAVVPTGATFERRYVPFAATGTGAYLAGRAAPTGTGAYLAGRAAPTGTGAYLAGRAAPTGTGYLAGRAAPTGYGPQGWNATSYYYGSNDRLA